MKFVKLTEEVDDREVWLRADRIIRWSVAPNNRTYVSFQETDTAWSVHVVKESPEEILAQIPA